MRTQPDGAQLLHAARQVLLDELLPALPAPQRHAGLMLAKALEIAARQAHGHGDLALLRAELADLRRLLGLPALAAHVDADADALALQARWDATAGVLVARLRSRAVAHRAEVHRLLLAATRRQVEQSNPKYLAAPSPRAD